MAPDEFTTSETLMQKAKPKKAKKRGSKKASSDEPVESAPEPEDKVVVARKDRPARGGEVHGSKRPGRVRQSAPPT